MMRESKVTIIIDLQFNKKEKNELYAHTYIKDGE